LGVNIKIINIVDKCMREITTELQNEILKIAAKNLPFSKYAQKISTLLQDKEHSEKELLESIMQRHKELQQDRISSDSSKEDLDFIVTTGELDTKILSKMMQNILSEEEAKVLSEAESMLENKINDYFLSSKEVKTPEGLIDYCTNKNTTIITPEIKTFLVSRIKGDFANQQEKRSISGIFKEILSNTELLVKVLTLALVVAMESHSKLYGGKESMVAKSLSFVIEEFGVSRDNISGQFRDILKGFASIISPSNKEKSTAENSNNKTHLLKGISSNIIHRRHLLDKRSRKARGQEKSNRQKN